MSSASGSGSGGVHSTARGYVSGKGPSYGLQFPIPDELDVGLHDHLARDGFDGKYWKEMGKRWRALCRRLLGYVSHQAGGSLHWMKELAAQQVHSTAGEYVSGKGLSDRIGQTLGLRVAPWESDYIAYNYAAFFKQYGDGAWDIWSNSAKVTDRNCNWRVCWVRLGEEIRKCPVAKLKTCGSGPIKTLLELCHRSSTEIECFIDLNDIAGTTNERSAKKVLDYFLDHTCSWQMEACNSGDLDLVDRLEIIHLQWLVPRGCWWSWYNARHNIGVISETSSDTNTNPWEGHLE